jgi:peptidoglycan/LPS O-acetylase OafA/YrhL
MIAMEFMRIRLIRLYPLYILGTILGALRITASAYGGNAAHWTGAILSMMTIFGVVMLPNFTGTMQWTAEWTQREMLFPLNVPCWSLFLEIAVNLGFGLLWRRLAACQLVVMCGFSGVLVLISLWANGNMDMGAAMPTLIPGLIRTVFGFSVGVLIARHSGSAAPKENAGLFVAICVAFLLAIAGAFPDGISAMLLFPVIVYAATRIDPPSWLRPAATFLGVTSYAVYVLHAPFLALVNSVLRRTQAIAGFNLALVLLVALLCCCWLVDRYYDFPVRRMLSRKNLVLIRF